MAGMQDMMSGAMMDSMHAQMQKMESMTADQATAMLPMYRQMCHLNRRTAQVVVASGAFHVESVESHMGGSVQHIVAVRAAEDEGT
jgi:hypothetical protein